MVILLAAACLTVGGCKKDDDALECHVGGTMRPVMEELARLHELKTGQKVEINSAGSGELLAHIESTRRGDFYVCHDPFLPILMRKGLGRDGWTVAELTPVIVVRKGNPLNIRGVKDLARKDVRLVLTDYEKSSLGHMLPTIFAKAGIDFQQFNKDKMISTHRKGGEAATKVQTNNADAALVWNAVAHLRKGKLDAVPITPHLPALGVDSVTSATGKDYYLMPMRVTIATLKCSTKIEAAREFAEFVASEEAGEVFKRFGFTMNRKNIFQEYADGEVVKARPMPR